MDLIKVLILGIIVSILAVLFKSVKQEYSIICIIVGSLIIVLYILNSLLGVIDYFLEIVDKTGIDSQLFIILLKIVGLGYLVEFSAGVCRDSGNSSIADKVVLAGKILIFIMSMPIISNLFNIILELI